MSKITIDLPTDTTEKLKKFAEEDCRPLGNYLKVALMKFANTGALFVQNSNNLGAGTSPSLSSQLSSPSSISIEQLQQQLALLQAQTGIQAQTSIKLTAPLTEEQQREQQEEEKEKKKKKFLALAKKILSYELVHENDYFCFDGEGNRYYDPEYAEPMEPGSQIKCVYIYNLPYDRQVEYLNEFKHYYPTEEDYKNK